jgi:hypothetical protein
MQFRSLDEFLSEGKDLLRKGPIGLILIEDEVEVYSTIRHHLDCGIKTLICFAAPGIAIPEQVLDRVHAVEHDMLTDGAVAHILNSVIPLADGQWLYYCFNAEYLFYPFSEHRSLPEMLAFHAEERRDAMLTYVVDLYAGDLDAHPGAVSIEDAHLDRSGYYALERRDRRDRILERQLDFFGGLRWRFEEHVPVRSRRIDRISIFRARPGLVFRPDFTFSDEEYNTYACPWHNNLTAAICSFRTAKALKRNPGSAFDIRSFKWRNSAPFTWHSQLLLDLGLMEPGQWF